MARILNLPIYHGRFCANITNYNAISYSSSVSTPSKNSRRSPWRSAWNALVPSSSPSWPRRSTTRTRCCSRWPSSSATSRRWWAGPSTRTACCRRSRASPASKRRWCARRRSSRCAPSHSSTARLTWKHTSCRWLCGWRQGIGSLRGLRRAGCFRWVLLDLMLVWQGTRCILKKHEGYLSYFDMHSDTCQTNIGYQG